MERPKTKLAPSKSTVYISNLPFSFTNNDIHKLLECYGKIVKVTIVKDKQTRKSRGVAFVLFLNVEDARKCALALNGSEVLGRTIKSSIANDNGRAPEFIRRREYPDKSRCYECGEGGHLSYNCPKNLLGERERPKSKKLDRKSRKKLSKLPHEAEEALEDEDESAEVDEMDTWSAAVNFSHSLGAPSASGVQNDAATPPRKRPKIRQDTYFSDEECLDDG